MFNRVTIVTLCLYVHFLQLFKIATFFSFHKKLNSKRFQSILNSNTKAKAKGILEIFQEFVLRGRGKSDERSEHSFIYYSLNIHQGEKWREMKRKFIKKALLFFRNGSVSR